MAYLFRGPELNNHGASGVDYVVYTGFNAQTA
jgi:hypothetical protein